MVSDKVVCERWGVTKLCLKDGVWQSCDWKMVCDKVVFERLCATKLCLKDGVWQSCVWRSARGRRRGGRDTEPKTRTPHKDVGNKCMNHAGWNKDKRCHKGHAKTVHMHTRPLTMTINAPQSIVCLQHFQSGQSSTAAYATGVHSTCNKMGLLWLGDVHRFKHWIWPNMQHLDIQRSLKDQGLVGDPGRIPLENEDVPAITPRFCWGTSGFLPTFFLGPNITAQ